MSLAPQVGVQARRPRAPRRGFTANAATATSKPAGRAASAPDRPHPSPGLPRRPLLSPLPPTCLRYGWRLAALLVLQRSGVTRSRRACAICVGVCGVGGSQGRDAIAGTAARRLPHPRPPPETTRHRRRAGAQRKLLQYGNNYEPTQPCEYSSPGCDGEGGGGGAASKQGGRVQPGWVGHCSEGAGKMRWDGGGLA
eukprot:350847-Chlamydomonas_euryale.AAC.1